MVDKAEVCSCCEAHSKTLEKAKSNMPKEKDIDNLSAFFKVLGDPTRIKMLYVLGQGELCVCDIAAALSMTKSAISHQLSGLKQASLVKSRREGKNVYYSIDDSHVSEVVEIAFTHITHKK